MRVSFCAMLLNLSPMVWISVPRRVACAPAPFIMVSKLPISVTPLARALMKLSLICPALLPVASDNPLIVLVICSIGIPAPSASRLALIMLSWNVPALSAISSIPSFIVEAMSMNVCATITSPALPSCSTDSDACSVSCSSSSAAIAASLNPALRDPIWLPASRSLSTSSVSIPSVSARLSNSD